MSYPDDTEARDPGGKRHGAGGDFLLLLLVVIGLIAMGWVILELLGWLGVDVF